MKMKNKQKYYKTTFEIVVLSEEPIIHYGLDEIYDQTMEGDCLLHSVTPKQKIVTSKQMADYCYDAGSEPEFFNLNDNGNSRKL